MSNEDNGVTPSSHGLSAAASQRKELSASYYPRDDVMYLTIMPGAPAISKHGALGVVLRYDRETEQPIGATIIDFSCMWGSNPQLRIPMVDEIAHHLKLPRQPIYEALRDEYHEPRGLSAAEGASPERVIPNPVDPTPGERGE